MEERGERNIAEHGDRADLSPLSFGNETMLLSVKLHMGWGEKRISQKTGRDAQNDPNLRFYSLLFVTDLILWSQRDFWKLDNRSAEQLLF